MKWFKHEANARNDVKIKILMQRHGIEGYGIYFIMLELIAEYATEKNITEWGFVDKVHKKLTLAAEAHTSPEKLKEVLATCNELDLFQEKSGRLFCRQILNRLDEYATKVQRKLKNREGKKEEKEEVRTESGQYPVRVEKNRLDQKRTLVAKSQPHALNSFEKTLDGLIGLMEVTLKTKITNRGKQMKALKMIFDSGYTEKQTKNAIIFMATKDAFFKDKGFDLITVANQLPRYQAEANKESGVT